MFQYVPTIYIYINTLTYYSLFNFPSSCCGALLKAYKSLEGYKFTQSGFVIEIQIWNRPTKDCAQGG